MKGSDPMKGSKSHETRPNRPAVLGFRLVAAACAVMAAVAAHMTPSVHPVVSASVGLGVIMSVAGLFDGQTVGSAGFVFISIGGMLTQLRGRGAPWLAVIVVALAFTGSEFASLANRLRIVVPYDGEVVGRRVNETLAVCGVGTVFGLVVVLFEGVHLPASGIVTVLGGVALVVLVGAMGWGPTLARQVRRRPPHNATAARKHVSDNAITSGMMNDENAAR
jgi:hypothetical protein